MENLERVFIGLVYMSLMGSILICLVMLIRHSVGSKISISYIQVLWLFVVARLILPYMPESPLGILDPNHIQGYSNSQRAITRGEVESARRDSHVEHRVPMTTYSENNETTIGGVEVASAIHEIDMSIPNTMGRNMAIQKVSSIRILSVLSVIWLLGLGGVLLGIGYVLLRSHRPPKTYPRDTRYGDIIAECKRQLGIEGEVEVYKTQHTCPYITGICRPRIYLPETMPSSLTREQIFHILLHELVHYKRMDGIYNLLWCMVMALHWFNPCIWIAYRRARLDQEIACDGHVLKLLGDEGAVPYGITILMMARFLHRGHLTLNVACTLGHRKQLERRVYMIKKYRRVNNLALAILMGIGLLLVSTIFTTKPVEGMKDTEGAQKVFEMYAPNQRMESLEALREKLGYDFLVPDRFPESPYKGFVTRVLDIEYYTDYAYYPVRAKISGRNEDGRIYWFIADRDISDELEVSYRVKATLGGIEGERFTAYGLPTDPQEVDVFAFVRDGIYYMLAMKTELMSLSTEEMNTMLSSLKLSGEETTTDYTIESNAYNIYDFEGLVEARGTVDFNFTVPQPNIYFRIRLAHYNQDTITFNYGGTFTYVQSLIETYTHIYTEYLEQESSEELEVAYTINSGGIHNFNKAHWEDINGHKVLIINRTYPEGNYEDFYYIWQVDGVYHTLSLSTSIGVSPVFHKDIVIDFMDAPRIDTIIKK